MKQADINELRKIIDSELDSEEKKMLYKDTFATGCFLHKIGQKVAGRKICDGIFCSLGSNKRRPFFSSILNTLDGNEDFYASLIGAHGEITNIFKCNSLKA